MPAAPTASPPLRAGFCAIVGLPNVGKSTLLNTLLGKKLCAVSAKPQTTRNRIVGVVNRPGAQIALVDTPGLQRGKGALRRYLRDQALGAAGECDAALLVVDATDRRQGSPDGLAPEDAADIASALGAVPTVVALNKVDLVGDKGRLLPAIEAWAQRRGEVVPISALTGDGVERLVAAVAAHLPEGQRLFPEDMITDRAEPFLAGELVREQLFAQLGDELPYTSAVVVERFEERRDRGDIVVDAVVYVERDSQKGIVVGKAGARIKAVGQAARAEIGRLFGCPVHLQLFVKVSADWTQHDKGLARMGYQ